MGPAPLAPLTWPEGPGVPSCGSAHRADALATHHPRSPGQPSPLPRCGWAPVRWAGGGTNESIHAGSSVVRDVAGGGDSTGDGGRLSRNVSRPRGPRVGDAGRGRSVCERHQDSPSETRTASITACRRFRGRPGGTHAPTWRRRPCCSLGVCSGAVLVQLPHSPHPAFPGGHLLCGMLTAPGFPSMPSRVWPGLHLRHSRDLWIIIFNRP